jgi:hypothetical protein
MRPGMRRIVHCSGYSLAEKRSGAVDRAGKPVAARFNDWDEVCLGDPRRGTLGRIPKALRVANRTEAECIIWSTGATLLDHSCEAEFMFNTALTLVPDLVSREHLRRISILEAESTNTFSSMVHAHRLISGRYGDDNLALFLISSANHAPRVARDAAVLFARASKMILNVVPAHSSYGGKRPEDVRILELGT